MYEQSKPQFVVSWWQFKTVSTNKSLFGDHPNRPKGVVLNENHDQIGLIAAVWLFSAYHNSTLREIETAVEFMNCGFVCASNIKFKLDCQWKFYRNFRNRVFEWNCFLFRNIKWWTFLMQCCPFTFESPSVFWLKTQSFEQLAKIQKS